MNDRDVDAIREPNILDVMRSFEPSGSIICAALVDDKNVYFGSGDCHVYSIDKKDGKLNWKFRTRGIVGMSSPVIENGILYIGSFDGYIYAINVESGKLKWEFRTNDMIGTSPAVYENKLLMSSTDGNLYCLKADDGKLLWQKYLGKPIAVSPRIVNGNIYIGSWVERNFQCISMEGNILWKVNANHWPTNCAFATPNGKFLADFRTHKNVNCEDFVFTFGSWNNMLYLVDDKGEVVWKENIGTKLAPPTIYEGSIYAGSFDGNIYSFSMKDCHLNWKYTTGDTIVNNVPLIYKDVLYTSSCDGNVYSLDPKTGQLIWRFQTAGPIISPPVIENNILYIGSWDSNLYVFDVSDPRNPKLLWKFQTGMPPATPVFVKWISEFETFKEKYMQREWKPETISANSQEGRKGAYGETSGVGIGDYSAFSRNPYQGFGKDGGEGYSFDKDKKRDPYKK